MTTPEDADMDRIKAAREALSEHFDTVQIFVTRQTDKSEEDEGTVNATWGYGNWFARKGQIDTWSLKQDERSRKEVREED